MQAGSPPHLVFREEVLDPVHRPLNPGSGGDDEDQLPKLGCLREVASRPQSRRQRGALRHTNASSAIQTDRSLSSSPLTFRKVAFSCWLLMLSTTSGSSAQTSVSWPMRAQWSARAVPHAPPPMTATRVRSSLRADVLPLMLLPPRCGSSLRGAGAGYALPAGPVCWPWEATVQRVCAEWCGAGFGGSVVSVVPARGQRPAAARSCLGIWGAPVKQWLGLRRLLVSVGAPRAASACVRGPRAGAGAQAHVPLALTFYLTITSHPGCAMRCACGAMPWPCERSEGAVHNAAPPRQASGLPHYLLQIWRVGAQGCCTGGKRSLQGWPVGDAGIGVAPRGRGWSRTLRYPSI